MWIPRGAALIRGRQLFLAWHLLEEIQYLHSFQYKILRNILFLSKKQYIFRVTKSPICSYCNTYDETPINLFCESDSTKYLWLQLNRHFHYDLTFPF